MARRWASRTDRNHAEIVEALTGIGFSVHDSAAAGKGFPDVVVGFKVREGPLTGLRLNVLAEIKDGEKPPSGRRLTPDQRKFLSDWKGAAVVLHTVAEALWLFVELRSGKFDALDHFAGRLPDRFGRILES